MDGSYTAPPDPATATTPAELIERMRELRKWAGQPSLRALCRLAGTTSAHDGAEVDALPVSTASDLLRGRSLPRLPRMVLVETYVTACLLACGAPADEIRGRLDRWRQAWRALADAANPLAPSEPGRPSTADARPDDRTTYGASETDPAWQAPAARGGVPAELPADTVTFTGRHRELARLDLLLKWAGQVPDPVVITAIGGTAGVGKTALAVHWAHRIAERFPDGQLFLNLRGYASAEPVAPAEALGRLLRALDLPPDRVPDEEEERAAKYRSLLAGKRVLVVLDNARTADQVRPLLPGQPGCLAVITSRQTLAGLSALNDAHLLSLGLLGPDEAITLLARILGAGRLAREPEAAAELVRLSGCLPLALRIATAHLATRDQSIADLVARLKTGDRLATLQVHGDPHAAVHVAFDQSYNALDEEARLLFRRLGLLSAADFAPHAAAVLSQRTVEDATQLLERLADAHLLERHPRGRYRLHDLLGQYAGERVHFEESKTDRVGAIERTLTWYLNSGNNAIRALNPSDFRRVFAPGPPDALCPPLDFAEYEQALEWCEAERVNVVAGVRQAADNGLHTLSWQLSLDLWYFFLISKHWADWIVTHQIGLASARRLGDRHMEAWSLNRLGHAYAMARRFEEALECCRQASPILREVSGRFGEGAHLITLGVVYDGMGHPGEAIDALRSALTIFGDLGDRWELALTTMFLGEACQKAGRLDEAIDNHQRALILYRELGHHFGEARIFNNLGTSHQHLGQYSQAIRHHRDALGVRLDVGDRWGAAETLNDLANALYQAGETHPARQTWQQAIALLEELGDDSTAAEIHTRLQTIDIPPTA